MRIGIDTGGTFTDFVVAHESGEMEAFKLRSNPANPASVILAGLDQIGAGKNAEVVHGSTVATNALLERKGARTALVTTGGFEDVIQIGRQNRAQLYVLSPPPKRILAEEKLCLGVNERTYFDGTVAARPPAGELEHLAARLKRLSVESVAISFLHSYANHENERATAAALRKTGLYICCSHEICPEFREYERTTTTFLNAYVGPLMDRYLGSLENARAGRLWIMQSNGGVISAREARNHAVRTLLSGPAGGAIGAVEAGRRSGYERILGFDMGGTSTDISLSEGSPRETMEAYIDGLPVRVPMLDIQTVGAGGGSIARVDVGGLLRVGPQSAGADPGPACYGKGTDATVTDAHVVLGRIRPDEFLGGSMPLDFDRAALAIDRIATALKMSRRAAAEGILKIANANMERLIRAVSVERGYDPRQFALVAFGGCGGLHACEIADDLGIATVIVPQHAGVLSALGMLEADRMRDYSAGMLGRTDIDKQFRELEKRARKDLKQAVLTRFADIRYAGQSYELTIPWGSSFHDAHQKMYGYADRARSTEVVAIRVRAIEAVPRLKPALSRRNLSRGKGNKPARGPALIADYGSTTYVPGGWSYVVDRAGNLVIRKTRPGAPF
jgi:N-methylhydantoinase A/oxoprolinase/acetone carboxylase beta subunit